MLSSLWWPPERGARVWVSHSTTLEVRLDAIGEGSGPSHPWFGLWNLNFKGCRGNYSWFARVAEPCGTYSCTLSRPAQSLCPCSISIPPFGFVVCFFQFNDFCRSSCGNLKGSWSQNSDTLPSSTVLLHVQIMEGELLNFQARDKNRHCRVDPRLNCTALV